MGTPIDTAELLRRVEVLERVVGITPPPPRPLPALLWPPVQELTFAPLTEYFSRCPSCGQAGSHDCLGANHG